MAFYPDLGHLIKGTPRQRRRRATVTPDNPNVPARHPSTGAGSKQALAGKGPPAAPAPGTKAALAGTGHAQPRNNLPHPVTFNPGTTTVGGFDLANTLSKLIAAGGGSSAALPASSPSRELAEEEGKNLLEVAQEHLPGHGGLRSLIPHAPSGKEAQAAALIVGAALPADLAAAKASDVTSAIEAGQKIARGAGAAAKVARGGIVRKAVGRAVAKAEPEAVRAARQAAARRAGTAARALPRPVRIGGRLAGQGVAYPVKHPFTAPLAIQTPAAFLHGGPGIHPSEYLKALEGKGTLASITGVAGKVAPVVGEAANLPASVLPTAFLTGRAAVNAAQGNSKELDELKQQYLKTGLIPALFSGDPATALKRLGEHPLYSGLEASLLASALGRGAGIAARSVGAGGLERAPLTVRGTPVRVARGYSRDLIRQGIQRAVDKASGNQVRPDTLRGRHILKEAANRWESGQEAIRKSYNHRDLVALKKSLPHKWGRLDRKSAEVVNLAVERIIQHPETFNQDLPLYQQMLEDAAKQKRPDGTPLLDKAQRANNKALLKQIKAARSGANPEAVVKSANAFIELQKPILEEMVDLKLIDPQQAAKASAVSFARVHMGSKYGIPPERASYIAEKISTERQLANAYEKAIAEKAPPETIAALADAHAKAVRSIADAEKKYSRHLDQNGNPLSLDQITAEMNRRGVEPPGFTSHRSPTPGDFYQPNFGGAILPRGVRTGESVATGSQLGGIEALARQLHRARGLVLRAKAWNKAVTDFGIKVHGIDTAGDARLVNADPARYGLDPSLEGQLVAVPRYPFGAKKEEIAGALEHQDPSIAGDLASEVVHNALDEGLKGQLAPDTKVVLMPRKVVEEIRAGTTPAGGGLRGAQAATTLFTRTVLPFSPGWHLGNFFDNYTRTILGGANPLHYYLGNKLRKGMSVEHEAELLAGAHYASLGALNPHRSIESLLRSYDPVSKTIKAAATWSERHGKKQMIVKFGPRLLAKSSDVLVKMNAFITEDLPQRAVLGKAALNEFHATQGSWVKALLEQKKLAESFQKGLDDPATMIRFQKALEEVQGNYTRMSPAARKYLRNISPFWTWFRAAYKFVYLTMPAHHPIQTGLLTGAARATKPTREQYGLVKSGEGGKNPLPGYMQSAIPLRGGGAFPLASYSSFGYASNPIEAVARLPFPQFQSVIEALRGRDWKGEPLEGGDNNKIATALWSLATAFIPGAPLFAQEKEGKRTLGPQLPSLPHVYDRSYIEHKRKPTQTITVPKSEGTSSSGGYAYPDLGPVMGGGSSSAYPELGSVIGR